ncbi:MAG TPA: PHB depolymerase family esterase [Prosthecobacter sp.]|nr:PHB depolymerase family esterase [Prosthecobacter sp.]
MDTRLRAVSDEIMKLRHVFLLPLCLFTVAQAAEPKAAVKEGVRSPISFNESPEISSGDQLKMRLRSAEDPAPYDIKQEQFEILVPKGYKESDPHGLFIWISAGDKPSISPEWDKVLAEKKLIFIGAFKSGNNREVFDRMRLALDANHNLRGMYNVDPKRVYVSGHSGGARVASMLGVAYADMFTGAVCFMGVNYFRATQAPDGTLFDMRYLPHPEIAKIAITENRYVLVTGEKDFNRVNTQTIYEQGFKKEGFQAVKLFDIPGQAHSPPSGEWLEKALDYLDKQK